MSKTREIDETEFLSAQGLAKTVNGIMANPNARKLMLQAQKLAYPATPIPELDAAAPVMDELTKANERMATLEKQIADDKSARETKERNEDFVRTWESKKNVLRKQGYTDEGIEAVEKLAQERGIADLDAAAALFDKLHPPAEPVSPNGFGGFDMFSTSQEENKDMKALIDSRGEDETALRGLVSQALTETRNPRR